MTQPYTSDSVASGYAAGLYGGFWRRLGAYIIDGIILAIAGSLLELLHKHLTSLGTVGGIVSLGIVLLLLYGYCVHLIYKRGATPGKMVLRLRVVNLQGKRVSYKQAWLRVCPYIALYVLPILAMIGIESFASPDSGAGWMLTVLVGCALLSLLWYLASIIVLLCNPYKRTLHDFVARTVVIHNPPQYATTTPLPAP